MNGAAKKSLVPPRPIKAGELIGSYIVERQLRVEGGLAIYAARHCAFEQKTLLRVSVAAETAERPAFLHLLDHPGIERVLVQGKTPEGLAYTATERIDGTPIDTYCDQEKVGITGRTRLLLQAVEALAYAHRHLQPHYQLTATNLLVTSAGQVKVCGFGALNPSLPAQHALAADVQCLAEIAALLYSGLPLNRAPMSSQLAAQSGTVQHGIAHARGTTSERLQRSLWGDLDAIVTRASESTAAKRYASIDLLGLDLERTLKGQPTSAYRASRWERLNLWMRHQPTTALAAALLVLAASGASAAFLYQTAMLKQERHEAELRLTGLVAMTGALETRLYDAAGAMPKPVPVRMALVNRTRETLDTATADGTFTPELAKTVARQYGDLAERRLEHRNPTAAKTEPAHAGAGGR